MRGTHLSFFAVLLLFAARADAQIFDDFSDGDFDHHPTWTGDTSRWAIDFWEDGLALRSNGLPAADTIGLSLETDIEYGRWSFTWGHRNVNLSTFNGARIFLCHDGSSPRASPRGIYLQLGTNNTDALSLWRVDGSWSERDQLARSAEAVVAGDSSTLSILVDHDLYDRWTVTVEGRELLSVAGTAPGRCSHFSLWIKHSSSGARSFFLDDLYVEQTAASPPTPPSAPPSAGDVVVNEVLFDPLSGGSEFIELINRSANSIDLQTLTLRDSRSDPIPISREPYVVDRGEYAVLVQDGPRFRDHFRSVEHIEVSGWPTLNNGGDQVIIQATTQIIDSLTYSGTLVRDHVSLERIDPDAPSTIHNFAESNDAFGATPGMRNSQYNPDMIGPSLVFASQMGPAQLKLYFSEPISVTSVNAASVHALDATADVLKPIESDKLHAEFDRPLTAADVKVDSVRDVKGNLGTDLSHPIAYIPSRADVVINEILYEPRADEHDGLIDQVEYLELLNQTDRLVTLQGVYLTRRANEHGDADTVRISHPFASMRAHSFALISADSIHAGLLTEPVAQILLPIRLPNDGDSIRLHAHVGEILDEAIYGPSLHHADVLERRGIALERIDPRGPGVDAANWTSSVSRAGGTPGTANSVHLTTESRTSSPGVEIEPNPFSPDRDGHEDVTGIRLTIHPGLTRARVRIFDLTGILVRNLVPGDLVAGSTSYIWDGRDDAGHALRPGVYIVLVHVLGENGKPLGAYKAAAVIALGMK